MMKSIRSLIRQDREKYVIPRRVQEVIPIQQIWEDGIFHAGGRFAKTFRFSDINYQVASEPDKLKMIRAYCALINSLDCSATTKITVFNHKMSQINFEQSILMEMQWDGLDAYREEYNQMLLDKATNGNGIVQEKFITVSIRKRDVDAARSFFTRRESVLYTGRRGRDCRCSTVAGGKCWRGAILELVWIYQPCGMVRLLCKLVRRPVRIPGQRCISEVFWLCHGYAVVSAARTLAGSNHRASSGYAHIL